IVLYMILSTNRDQKSQEYLEKTSKKLAHDYTFVLNSFKDKAEIAFHTLINTDNIKSLLKQTFYVDEIEKNRIRRELYDKLLPTYQKLKKFGFQQVHFHQTNNLSFLRMHAPSRYGDDLSSFRKTVKYVNESKKSISGFEEGIINNGFRFVFPLFDGPLYLGSVELSFPSPVLVNYLNSDFLTTQFLIDKDALVSKDMGRVDHNYVESTIHPDFFTDNSTAHQLKIPFEKRFDTYIKEDLRADNSFSLAKEIEDKSYILSFIPIENVMTKKKSAYLVIVSNDSFFAQRGLYFWALYSTLSLIVFLLYTRLIKAKTYRKKIKQKNEALSLANKKLNTIINGVNHMVIITSGKEMIEVNQKVLDFFGFHSIDDMKSKAPCVCHFFLKHEDFFHLGDVPEGENWINYIQTLPENRRTVNMVGKDMIAQAFQVKVNNYGPDGKAIITISDITDMMIERKLLEYKAEHDILTDIYNRQKVNEVLQQLCSYSVQRKEEIGIIMLDIDHFKKINDQHGHDTGDEVLQALAKLIKQHIRADDIFGRWGGEEFILILRYATQSEVMQKAENLRVIVDKYNHSKLPQVTASLGVTLLQEGDTMMKLLKRADIALYEAKHKGRNRVELYHEDMSLEALV
ncbi:MAG: diguanylate cyclase, partial [Epsilonproteobacteria bacterium]|nr:diguanylate cyclase [Campylobacterota bacterium]